MGARGVPSQFQSHWNLWQGLFSILTVICDWRGPLDRFSITWAPQFCREWRLERRRARDDYSFNENEHPCRAEPAAHAWHPRTHSVSVQSLCAPTQGRPPDSSRVVRSLDASREAHRKSRGWPSSRLRDREHPTPPPVGDPRSHARARARCRVGRDMRAGVLGDQFGVLSPMRCVNSRAHGGLKPCPWHGRQNSQPLGTAL